MRSYVVGFFVVLTFFAIVGKAASIEIVADRIVLPMERREVSSPASSFVLVLATADKWKTPRGSAELYRVRTAERQLIWKRDLPHHHGPRRALVSDKGIVLPVDEWINVVSQLCTHYH